ncbi:MAG: MFS transporter, partial [Bacteroidetes bacterium]|nr:MFS transporter [Fibrella sp.]
PDPLNNLPLLIAAAFGVSVFGALQDAAVDGMAVDIITAAQQARANGFMGGSRMIGSSLGLTLGSWLLNTYNFTVSLVVLSLIIGLVTLVPIYLREQPGEKIAPWTAGMASPETKRTQLTNWSTIFSSLYSVFRLPNSLIVSLLMFVTMGAYNYFEHLLPIFAVTVAGWTNVSYSQAFGMADLVGGIGGMFLGGYLIERFGKKRMITIYFGLIIGITAALIFLKTYWVNGPFLYGFIIVYRWLNAFAKIGVYAVAMQCCSRKISASQFTTYMTLGSVGSLAGATLIGPMKENLSWELTFLSFVGMMALSWFIMLFLNIDKHVEQITELDNEEAEREALVLN